jgi:hypothetical protein
MSTGVTYLVYEFGQADTLKQFLAGLGLLGIAGHADGSRHQAARRPEGAHGLAR